jgi:hypothetical protein
MKIHFSTFRSRCQLHGKKRGERKADKGNIFNPITTSLYNFPPAVSAACCLVRSEGREKLTKGKFLALF